MFSFLEVSMFPRLSLFSKCYRSYHRQFCAQDLQFGRLFALDIHCSMTRAVCCLRSFHTSKPLFNKDQAQIPQYSWTNPDNVPKGTNLKKYGIDLTELAKQGKLDPVIGREEEIRRTLEVFCFYLCIIHRYYAVVQRIILL